jgi:hypothetical protein
VSELGIDEFGSMLTNYLREALADRDKPQRRIE